MRNANVGSVQPLRPEFALMSVETFERLSSILEINSWAVLTKTGCVQFFWVPSRGLSFSFVKRWKS